MNEIYNITTQRNKVEELHLEIQGWKSNLDFINDEITFIDHLLNSYAFQPNTQNLFERLQDYLKRIHKSKETKKQLQKLIVKHENALGGMIECTDASCDLTYYQKHDKLKASVLDYINNFRDLKAEIFNYAGGIMKKRKPNAEMK
ncbi:hypothetical protein JQC67_10615 [Aurantibacter crassamenti]|uniref:hypothetical protein n=1 Tax=Aurantibacter crassamenti TaxID=1837375 RepID=UPI00193AC5F1|nr:hypothetical protein [Aurantibacter crassamenti]MBM1106591.1 hypothetical protein [Aurantibacter crassamenti]